MASDVSLASSTTGLLSGSIKWSGLASGVDFGEVVDQLIELEMTHTYSLQAWRTEWEDKIESIESLNERMASVLDFVEGFDSYDEFYSRTSTSSNTGVVTVTNTSTAAQGTHTIEVGADIQGRVASRSYDSTAAVGGAAGATMTIQVGEDTLTLTEGVDYLATDTMDELAAKILTADTFGILADVSVVDDKDRDGTAYKRLIITGAAGGDNAQVTVTDPTDLNMDQNTFDEAYKTDGVTWLSDTEIGIEDLSAYTGTSNKTFTFRVVTTGILGSTPITMQWADDEGNGGTFTVDDIDSTYYEVAQGLKIRFESTGGNDRVFADDSFTIEAYNPTLQAAQDEGLAKAARIVHEGYKDLLTPVTTADAEFVYLYAGEEITVAIDADTKLQGLVDAINNDTNNPGVTASILNDGKGTATSYHLVLTGGETGVEHSIQIGTSATPMTNFDHTSADFETAQAASNSMFKSDGYPHDDWDYLQRSTNTLGDIIDDVVMTIKGTGSATVTVSDNIDKIETNIETFVESVNFILDYIKYETRYDADTGETGTMIGNYTYDIVRSFVNGIVAASVPGLDSDTDVYSHLSQIGITTDPDLDGMWVIDSTKLTNALNSNLDAVARLFIRASGLHGQ